MKFYLSRLSIPLVALLLSTGCSTSKMSTQAGPDCSDMSYTERFDAFVADTMAWHTISFAGKLSLKSPVKESASIRVYMVRDSLIQVSLRKYGIEGGILRATADSIYLYSKTDNFLSSTSLSDLLGDSSITLADLQAAILGRYAPGIASISRYDLSPKSTRSATLNCSGTSTVKIKYSGWKPSAAIAVPTHIDTEILLHNLKTDKIRLSISISPSSISAKSGREPQWRPSSKVEIVDFDSIINFFIQST